MGEKLRTARSNWNKIKKTSAFHNTLVYLMFVAVATVFWFFMVMNDNVQQSIDFHLKITNVPDSVTFITDPPQNVHVSVRDKGTNLFRVTFAREPSIDVDFREYASDGVFRVTAPDFMTLVKQAVGQTAQVINVSVDSLRLDYTMLPGRKVPIHVVADVEAQTGKVVAGKPQPSVNYALLYSTHVTLDTISQVKTMPIVRRNLDENTTESVRIQPIAGVKIVPDKIDVTIPIEPLVAKTSLVPVQVVNIPSGQSVLLFPNKVEVSYYVPMSKFNDPVKGIAVTADYNHLTDNGNNRIKLHLSQYPPVCINPKLKTESVEYTIVK